MCATNACGCGSSTTFGGILVDGLFTALSWLLRQTLRAAAYLTAVAAVAAWRWHTGAPMWGVAAWPDGWPRWRRALARTAITAVAAAGVMWPWPTAAALAGAGSVTCAAVLERRRRQAAARAALAARRPIAAIAAVPHAETLTVAALLEGTR